MADVLQHGKDRPPRARFPRPRPLGRRGRLAAGASVVALAVAATLGVRAVTDHPAAEAVPPAGAPAAAVSLETAAAGLGVLPRGVMSTGDHVLFATASGTERLDLVTGAVTELPVPTPGRPVPDGLVAGSSDVVVPEVTGGSPSLGSVPAAFGFSAVGGPARELGPAERAVPSADGRGVWLDAQDPGGAAVRLVSLAPRRGGTIVALDRSLRLAADTPAGFVVTEAESLGRVRITVRSRADGSVTRAVGVGSALLDARGRLAVWLQCSQCPVAVSRLDTGAARYLDTGWLPGGAAGGSAAAARVSPDGRHVALVVSDGAGWDVVVSAAPGAARVGAAITVLRGIRAPSLADGRPRLGWTASGRLVVSDGRQLVAVAGGPHVAYRVPFVVPQHTALAVG